jgi:diguanylate cyclase (GGDEF)-like protein
MQLTHELSTAGIRVIQRPRMTKALAFAVVVGSLLVIFELDRRTGAAPVQHLYYLPIILASLRMGSMAGLGTSVASVVLYHLANPTLMSSRYKDTDIIQIVLFVVVALVTTRMANDARRLRRLATTDDLTGLHNLRSFEAQLDEMVRASRISSVPLAMLVLDVDRLKTINDTHGHLAGAEAVRLVGHTLAAHLPPEAVACRYGGDEFAIAIAGCGEYRGWMIADKLRGEVHALAPMLASKYFRAKTLSISVGLACSNGDLAAASDRDDARVSEALFRAADSALYQAKEQGGNCVSAG